MILLVVARGIKQHESLFVLPLEQAGKTLSTIKKKSNVLTIQQVESGVVSFRHELRALKNPLQ